MRQYNASTEENEGFDKNDGRLVTRRENLDYDEQPYGNDNVLVRHMKRRSHLISVPEF